MPGLIAGLNAAAMFHGARDGRPITSADRAQQPITHNQETTMARRINAAGLSHIMQWEGLQMNVLCLS